MEDNKKYAEALERAKDCLKDGGISKNTIAYLEEIFPELRESEDKRIRKALFEYFTTSDNNAYYEVCGVATKKILAWLEKQGEQKYSEWSKADKEYRDAAIYYLRSFCNPYKVEPILEWLESLESKVLPQPKQEWSEEDETHRHWILEMLKAGEIKTPEFADHFKAAFNWLKSLRPNNRWKPSKEQLHALFEAHKQMSAEYHIPLITLYNDLKKLTE